MEREMYESPKCKDCKYFQPREVKSLDGEDLPTGECRRAPPVIFHETHEDGRMIGMTYFPIIRGTDWCGEFKSRTDW